MFNLYGDAVRNQIENCSGVIYKVNSNSKQAKALKETELHCLAPHWLMRVWSCVVCCESSLSSSESIRESTLVSVHQSCDVSVCVDVK